LQDKDLFSYFDRKSFSINPETMSRYFKITTLWSFITLFCVFSISGQQIEEISVMANKPGAEIQPIMWGVFFEDINFAADGGIYAELVKNRSFEFALPLTGWKLLTRQNGNGRMVPNFYSPSRPSNPHFMRIYIDPSLGTFGFTNDGFRGMGIRKDGQYNFSVSVRLSENSDAKMTVELITPAGETIGKAELSGFSGTWGNHQVSFKASATEQKAQMRIILTGRGSIDLDMISLFPDDTWKGRQNGLRKDIVEMIADLKPGFIRFPGGCIVEGRDIANRYQWKTTIGPIEDRKMIMNRWNVEIQNRQAPDYFQTFGLGFFEYFLLAEDIGAEPLPILNCGMSCQFNAAEVVPLDELDQYVQDALDLIEFANGEITTKWGNLRAELGHPGKFNMKFIGVGNEQWEEQYIERYKIFEKAIKTKYPDIKIVSGSGPSPSGRYFEYGWSELKKLNPDLIDEHYYMAPEWFLKNAARYDNYDRNGIKVFAGEYAVNGKEGTEPESRNTWLSALCEAAFMTGLERNADVVNIASYAPLLAHVDAWQWRPDLIWFDNLTTIGTPNYYVQKLFSNYKGTRIVPILSEGKTLTGQEGLYASSTIDMKKGKLYIKIVNSSDKKKQVTLALGALPYEKNAIKETLKSVSPDDFNTIANPRLIYPVTTPVKIAGRKIITEAEPLSMNVFIIDFKTV
jgi:alpha-N-arabinofuranosidase